MLVDQFDCHPSFLTNTTHCIDAYYTHMDKEKQQQPNITHTRARAHTHTHTVLRTIRQLTHVYRIFLFSVFMQSKLCNKARELRGHIQTQTTQLLLQRAHVHVHTQTHARVHTHTYARAHAHARTHTLFKELESCHGRVVKLQAKDTVDEVGFLHCLVLETSSGKKYTYTRAHANHSPCLRNAKIEDTKRFDEKVKANRPGSSLTVQSLFSTYFEFCC